MTIVAGSSVGGGDISYFSKYASSSRKVNTYKSSTILEKLNEISSINDQIPSLHSEVRGEISALYSNWQTILGYKQINTLSYRLCVTLNQQLNKIKSSCDSIKNDANDIIDDENTRDETDYWPKAKEAYKDANKQLVKTQDAWMSGSGNHYVEAQYQTVYPSEEEILSHNPEPTHVSTIQFSYALHSLDYDNRNVRNYTLYISESGIVDLIDNIKTKVQSIKEQFDSISENAGAIGAALTDVSQYTNQIKTIATETNEELDEIINTFETNANSLYEMDRRVFNLTSEYGEAYDFNNISENWDSLSEEDKKALLQYSLLQYYISKGTYEDGDSATSGLKLFEVDMDDVKSQVEDWLSRMPDKNNKEEYANWLKDAPFDGVGFSIFAGEGENGPDLLKSIFEGQEDQPQETAATGSAGSGGGPSGSSGYSGGYSPSPDPAPEPETETPSDDPGTTDLETPPVEDPGATDPETPPTEDPGTTDPETPPADDPGTTDPETPPAEDPGTTDPETPPVEDPGTTDPETPPTEDPGTPEPKPEVGGESDWESVPDPNGDVQEPEVNSGEDTFTPPEEPGDTTIPEPNIDGTEPLPDPNGEVPEPEVNTGEEMVTPPEESGDPTISEPNVDGTEPSIDPNGEVPEPEVNTGEEMVTPPEETGDTTIPEPNVDGTEPSIDPNSDVPEPEVNTGEEMVTPPEEPVDTTIPESNVDGMDSTIIDPEVENQHLDIPNIGEGDVVSPAPDATDSENNDAISDMPNIDDMVIEPTDTGVAELDSNVLGNDPSMENMMSSTEMSDLTLDNIDPLDENPIDDFDFDDLMEGIDDKIGFSKVEIPKFGADIPLPTDPTVTDK